MKCIAKFHAFSISLLHNGLVLTASECPLNFTDYKTQNFCMNLIPCKS